MGLLGVELYHTLEDLEDLYLDVPEGMSNKFHERESVCVASKRASEREKLFPERTHLQLRRTCSATDSYKTSEETVVNMFNVTRQVLLGVLWDLCARLFMQITGYVSVKTKQGVPLPMGNIASTTLAEQQMQLMLGTIRDWDELLGTQGHMLLGK
jgi:hypothetical protein